MKSFLCFGFLVFALFAFLNPAFSQTLPLYSYTIPIGQILDSGLTGLTLPDGNIVRANRIGVGNGVSGLGAAGNGFWDQSPTSIGGPLNGINNINDFSNPTQAALTLPGFTGDKTPQKFTQISVDNPTLYIANNSPATPGFQNYANAIGVHIWFTAPVSSATFLFLDLDGSLMPTNPTSITNSNAEWCTTFAYRNNILVRPSSIVTGTNLVSVVNPAVGNSWNTAVAGAQAGTPNQFNTVTNPTIVNKTGTTLGNSDPDDITTQALFTFQSVNGFNHFYTFWGIMGNGGAVGSTSLQQNSGVSPFVIDVLPDYGDAPDSYGTTKASGGAVHGIYSSLKIGASTDAENDGVPGINSLGDNNAGTNDEDGATPPTIPNAATTGSEVITTYSVVVNTTNNFGKPAKLIGWIDWNNNGAFEASEAVVATIAANGASTTSLTWSGQTLVHPNGLYIPYTYMRLRLSTDTTLTTATPKGQMSNGEVEDYQVALNPGNALPIGIVDFEARSVLGASELQWKTLSEKNNKGFDIEHSTEDLVWRSIGFVPALAAIENESDLRNYSFKDPMPVPGIHYYRLKQIDFDGKYQYSIIKNVSFTDQQQVQIAPNPTAGSIHIKGLSGTERISVFDVYGKCLTENVLVHGASYSIDLHAFAAGPYTIKIMTNDHTYKMYKIIKQ